jgi:hypothetical protein
MVEQQQRTPTSSSSGELVSRRSAGTNRCARPPTSLHISLLPFTVCTTSYNFVASDVMISEAMVEELIQSARMSTTATTAANAAEPQTHSSGEGSAAAAAADSVRWACGVVC